MELIAEIQRILKLDSATAGLDALTSFTPVETLNSLFPDGQCFLGYNANSFTDIPVFQKYP